MASELTPEVLLQAYDAHIAEARSDLAQLKSVRATLQLKHDIKVKEKRQYLAHLQRKVKIRITNGGDYTRYAHAMEECYEASRDDETPVNNVLRRQAMLLSITHKCEVSKKCVEFGAKQNKKFAETIMKDIADVEDEKARMQIVYAKRKEDKERDIEKTKQYNLEMKILPQRMVINRLENMSTDMMDLQEEMMRRRQRQSKSIQQTLQEKSEKFKELRQNAFHKAKQRRESLGSQKTADYYDEDRSVASNKSGWSFRSGRSGKTAKSGRSAFSGVGVGGAKALFGAMFGKSSSTTLESEMTNIPLQIDLKSAPPSSAYQFMSGLLDKGEMTKKTSDMDSLDEDNVSTDTDPVSAEAIPNEVTISLEE